MTVIYMRSYLFLMATTICLLSQLPLGSAFTPYSSLFPRNNPVCRASNNEKVLNHLQSQYSLGDYPYYPPLTPLELANRKAELLLIAKLNHGDHPAIDDFKHFWFHERCELADTLTQANLLMGKGSEYWSESERLLDELIQNDPTWLEPKARLAKLLCLKASFEPAQELAQQVLDSKPWHFVTLQTMIVIATATNNSLLTNLYKCRQLPHYSARQERQEWVDRALQDAETILSHMMRVEATKTNNSTNNSTNSN